MKKSILVLALISFGLSGCGSDDKPRSESPAQPAAQDDVANTDDAKPKFAVPYQAKPRISDEELNDSTADDGKVEAKPEQKNEVLDAAPAPDKAADQQAQQPATPKKKKEPQTEEEKKAAREARKKRQAEFRRKAKERAAKDPNASTKVPNDPLSQITARIALSKAVNMGAQKVQDMVQLSAQKAKGWLASLIPGAQALREKIVVAKNPDAPVDASAANVIGDQNTLAGVSSGGGGFADTYAKETLDIAKRALSRMILSASPSLFEKFPADKNQKWLAELILKTELRKDLAPSRYGNPLKFDYDLTTGKMFATEHYVSSFAFGRFWTRPLNEQHRFFIEVMLDLLHEASHFYGIGVTEKSDPNSEAWAMTFMEALSGDILACESGSIRYSTASAILLHRPSGMTVANIITQERPFQDKVFKTLGKWRSALEENKTRLLVSPRIFLDQDKNEKTQIIQPEPEKKADGEDEETPEPGPVKEGLASLSVRKILELAGSKRATVLDTELNPVNAVMLLMEPVGQKGYEVYDTFRGQWPQSGETSLGAPVLSDRLAVYDRKLKFKELVDASDTASRIPKAPLYIFDQLRLDLKTMQGTYYYGQRTEVALTSGQFYALEESKRPFTKSARYQCRPLTPSPISIDVFLSEHELSKEAIANKLSARKPVSPTTYVSPNAADRSDFVSGIHDFMKKNEAANLFYNTVKFDGQSKTGTECQLLMTMSERGASEKTLVVGLNFGPLEGATNPNLMTGGNLGHIRTGFTTKDRKFVSAGQGGFLYRLSKAEVTANSISIRQDSAGSDYVHWNSEVSRASTEIEFNIKKDAATGKPLEVEAILFPAMPEEGSLHVQGGAKANCILR